MSRANRAANAGQLLAPGAHRHRQSQESISVSHDPFDLPISLRGSSNVYRKSSTERQLLKRTCGEEHGYSGKTGDTATALPISASAKGSTPRRTRSSVWPLTVRPTGTKDRHSKVRTAKGLRDRRVRLSAPTAIQFFDVQDRLGYDQPSKAVDWLIKKARAAIDELAPVEGVVAVGEESSDMHVRDRQQKSYKEHDQSSSMKIKDEEQILAGTGAGGARAESRAKARERARERAKEKTMSPGVAPPPILQSKHTTASTSAAAAAPTSTQPFASSSLQLLSSELPMFSTHSRQQFEGLDRPSDLSSILSPVSIASGSSLPHHLIPFASSVFSTNPATQTFMFAGEGSSLQYTTPPVSYSSDLTVRTISIMNQNQINNTTNSSRGTLQSTFSSPISSVQTYADSPMQMIGCQAQLNTFGVTAHSSIPGGAAFRRNSAELTSSDLQHHSCIPIRIRGMDQPGLHVEENRTTSSSMQEDFQ
ncbi:hypothetical protein KP509_01G003200 [Ceratopteris richardii]|nr:hypothetical protein KP509_01G003200 [Ceratopteris richardii]